MSCASMVRVKVFSDCAAFVMMRLSRLNDPHGEGEKGHSCRRSERGCHKDFGVTEPAPGRSPFRGGGEPKSVIDGKRRRLQCLRPDRLGSSAMRREPNDNRSGRQKLLDDFQAVCGALHFLGYFVGVDLREIMLHPVEMKTDVRPQDLKQCGTGLRPQGPWEGALRTIELRLMRCCFHTFNSPADGC